MVHRKIIAVRLQPNYKKKKKMSTHNSTMYSYLIVNKI